MNVINTHFEKVPTPCCITGVYFYYHEDTLKIYQGSMQNRHLNQLSLPFNEKYVLLLGAEYCVFIKVSKSKLRNPNGWMSISCSESRGGGANIITVWQTLLSQRLQTIFGYGNQEKQLEDFFSLFS